VRWRRREEDGRWRRGVDRGLVHGLAEVVGLLAEEARWLIGGGARGGVLAIED
jgi:hypothetical protein